MFEDINNYFSNIEYNTNEKNILNNNIITYLQKLLTITNDKKFIKLINLGLSSESVKSLTISIGKFQDSIYDIHQNNDIIILKLLGISHFSNKEMLSIENIYNNLTEHFKNINISAYDENAFIKSKEDGSFYDDFYELILLGKNNMLPLQNIDNLHLLEINTICSIIHDAWAIKTFFKYDSNTSTFIFNIDGFKKNGDFNLSRLELCVNYTQLTEKEQIKDMLSYAAILHTNKYYHINYIKSMENLGFHLKIIPVSIIDNKKTPWYSLGCY